MSAEAKMNWKTVGIILLILLMGLLGALTAGCARTEAGSFKRKAFLANLEFDEATAEVWETDATGRTNHYERWSVKGLRSDTQKALDTADKALDLGRELSGKVP